jgi:NADPH:quinone reductase-like Zn-dependent oxidoreductase
LALSTAAHGLYQKDMLNLPLPTNDPKSIGKALVVWGGSSAVGAATIQLAKASGLEVIATASPRNFDMVKGLGASAVFDYSSASIVDDIVARLKDKNVAGAYDGRTPHSAMGTY